VAFADALAPLAKRFDERQAEPEEGPR
jgi:hypothetical protein